MIHKTLQREHMANLEATLAALRGSTLHALFALIPGLVLDADAADPQHDVRVVKRAAFVAAVHSLGSIASGGELLYSSIAVAEGAARDAGELPLAAVVAAMSIVCIANSAEVVDIVFHAFDVDRNDSLTLEEMQLYLKTVLGFRLGHSSDATSTRGGGEAAVAKAANLANALAKATFSSMDRDHSGTISKEEFTAWYCDISGAEASGSASAAAEAGAGVVAADAGGAAAGNAAAKATASQPKRTPLGRKPRRAIPVAESGHTHEINGLLEKKGKGLPAWQQRWFTTRSHFLMYKVKFKSADFTGGVDLKGEGSTITRDKSACTLTVKGLSAHALHSADDATVENAPLRTLTLRISKDGARRGHPDIDAWYDALTESQALLRAGATGLADGGDGAVGAGDASRESDLTGGGPAAAGLPPQTPPRDAPPGSTAAAEGNAVSVLLFTVTLYANHAHNLTRSP